MHVEELISKLRDLVKKVDEVEKKFDDTLLNAGVILGDAIFTIRANFMCEGKRFYVELLVEKGKRVRKMYIFRDTSALLREKIEINMYHIGDDDLEFDVKATHVPITSISTIMDKAINVLSEKLDRVNLVLDVVDRVRQTLSQ